MQLGAFTASRVLGEGGSGTVYAARDASGLDVAVKVLRAEAELTPKEVARFLAEADRMRRVVHASLVPVVSAGVLPDGRPFIAMPLLVGETLAEKVARGRLAPEEALAFFEQLASALATIHQAGLIHRDVKPENVLVLAGPPSRAVLLDLGIARELAAAASTTTQAGRVRGTPAYMAPERFFGKPATIASDVYELGVTLYVMLAGRLPWEDVADRVHPRPLAAMGVVLPAELCAAVMSALATRPEDRPASVRALAYAVTSSMPGGLASLLTTAQASFAPPFAPPVAPPELVDVRADTTADVSRQPGVTPPAQIFEPTRPSRRAGRLALGSALAAALGVGGVASWRALHRDADAEASASHVAPAPASGAAAGSALPGFVVPSASDARPDSGLEAPARPPSSARLPPRAPASTRRAPSGPPGPGVGPSAPSPALGGDALAPCRAVSAIYCSKEWQATEPNAGAQCLSWENTLSRIKDPNAAQAFAESCPAVRAQAVSVLAQRRQWTADGGRPPGR